MTDVAASILMGGTPGAAADTVDVLVALAAVFCKVYARAEHAADVRVTLVKALLHDSIDEWTTVE